MHAQDKEPEAVTERWQDAGAGRHYTGPRWGSERAARRDPGLVADILRPYGARIRSVLDVPSGTGRLRTALPAGATYTGVDVSPAMLAEAPEGRLVRASAWRLPFVARAFDAVVCCRLLHHIADRAELDAVIAELVRCTRLVLVVSFWDAASLPAWRRRAGLRRPSTRVAIDKRELAASVCRAGAEVLGYRHVLRFVSQQAFFVAERPGERG